MKSFIALVLLLALALVFGWGGEALTKLSGGFGVALTTYNLMIACLGVVIGTIVGIIPGLGAINAVALLLPLTFQIPPNSAIILLAAVYYTAQYSGAITSILFNIPGEPWSVATTFDGHPMAIQGRAAEALIAAFTGSFFAGVVSMILFTFFAPPLAEFGLLIGPPEFFAILCLTFGTISGLGRGSTLKTVMSALVGFLLAGVGMDIVTGTPRLIFGVTELLHGVSFIVVVIGLFGLGEIFVTVEEGLRYRYVHGRATIRGLIETFGELRRYFRTYVLGTAVGFFLGLLPGSGATPASFASYGLAKKLSKTPEKFGAGHIEGVIAPEAADNAAGTAAMLPMVTLGIPTSPTVAVILGALFIWGLQPGPLLFQERPDFVWGLIASLYVGNVVGVLLNFFGVPLFAAIMRVPFTILTPIIITVALVAGYTTNNSVLDVWLVLFFGAAGYVMRKLDYPIAPLVMALILGDMMETSLRQSLIMGQGSFMIFLNRPIAATCLVAACLFFALPVLWPLLRRRR
jgi:putative tricarboxylic transport membrane protein